MMAFTIKLLAFYKTEFREGSRIIGCCDVALPEFGIKLHQMFLKRQGDDVRVYPPTRYVIRDGVQMLDAKGRRLREACYSFKNPETRAEFETAVLDALREKRPEIFEFASSAFTPPPSTANTKECCHV